MQTPAGISGVEWGTAMPLDLIDDEPLPPPSSGDHFEQLLKTMLPGVSQSPCVVHFTGDCGSCLTLYAATTVARRHGLPDPIAVTPDYGEAGGGAAPHQEPLIRELGLADWERPLMPGAVTDLLGPTARSLIERFGLLYPCIVNAFTPLLKTARGGSLIDGHGVDVMWTLWRGAPVAAALAARPSTHAYLRAGVMLAPKPVREWALARALGARFDFPWLREEVRKDYLTRSVRDLSSTPLAFERSLPLVYRHRCFRNWETSMQTLARAFDVRLSYPIGDRQAIANTIARGGVRGWPSAEALVRSLAPALPAGMHARPVRFGRVAYGVDAQAFASSWDGRGLDESIVDPARVRQAWDRRDVRAGGLLQSAWLAAEGGRTSAEVAPTAGHAS